MLRISEIILPLGADEQELIRRAALRLKVKPSDISRIQLVKKSVDARKKSDVHFICTVDAALKKPENEVLASCRDVKIGAAAPYLYQAPPYRKLAKRPVVVGFGPAGMFAALILAQAGQRPIVLERGAAVEEREQEVKRFWSGGGLDPESNVQFGEGGAGTFSDGKLNTGTKDRRARKVLEEFCAAGAPEEILYQAKPHIGTDKLPAAVKNIRKTIISLGGEVRFHTKLEQILQKGGMVCGVRLVSAETGPDDLETDSVILAIGHSARDTFETLCESGLAMEQKPFSVGTRIEHLQRSVNIAQYGRFAGHPDLGAADYKLAVHLKNGRGVYTFCMCPGGTVLAAASEQGRLVTNGMSAFARDGENANSALLVGVGPRDFGGSHPLDGVRFQRKLEEAAFRLGGGDYRAPVQRVEDFLKGRATSVLGEISPTYRPGVTPCSLAECLPREITESMQEGIRQMDGRLKGFAHPDAVLTAVESRSSSPVRILRGDDLQSLTLKGLYPCGEGAGYAGGIISAAVDGIRCAERAMALK